MNFIFLEDQLLELVEQGFFKDNESEYILERIIYLKNDRVNGLLSQLKRNIIFALELDQDQDQDYINWLTLKDELQNESTVNLISLRECRDPRITAARTSLKDYNETILTASSLHMNNIRKIYNIRQSEWQIKDYVDDFTANHPYPGISYGTMTYNYNGKWHETQIDGNTWIDLWVAAEKLLFESDSYDWCITEFSNPGKGHVELKADS